jgi:hypothetical protein
MAVELDDLIEARAGRRQDRDQTIYAMADD